MSHRLSAENPSPNFLLPEELIRRREILTRFENISLTDILDEQIPLDTNKLSKTYQLPIESLEEDVVLIPTVLGNEFSGKVIYKVVKGFHQVAVLRELAQTQSKLKIRAKVEYGKGEKWLLDQRIRNTNQERATQFARLAKWIPDAVHAHNWQSARLQTKVLKERLSASRIFTVVTDPVDRVPNHLTIEERDELRAWAQQKLKDWELKAIHATVNLRVAEEAAPDIVSRVRHEMRKSVPELPLSMSVLRQIVEVFPRNFPLQRKIVDAIEGKRIVVSELPHWLNTLSSVHLESERLQTVLQHPPLKISANTADQKKTYEYVRKTPFVSKKNQELANAKFQPILDEDESAVIEDENAVHTPVPQEPEPLDPDFYSLRELLPGFTQQLTGADGHTYLFSLDDSTILNEQGEVAVALEPDESNLLAILLSNPNSSPEDKVVAVYGIGRKKNKHLGDLIRIIEDSLRQKLAASQPKQPLQPLR